MTAAEFEFKTIIAIGQYKSIYKYNPIQIIVSATTVNILNDAGKIDFTNNNPKYLNMYISKKMQINGTLMELGTDYDKLLI